MKFVPLPQLLQQAVPLQVVGVGLALPFGPKDRGALE